MENTNSCRKDIARLEGQTNALRDLVNEQFRGRDEAQRLALSELKDRFAAMNELRQVVNDQAGTFLRTATYNAAHGGLVRDVAQIRDTMATRTELGSITSRLIEAEKQLSNWNTRVVTAIGVFMLLGGSIAFLVLRLFEVRQ